MQRFLKQFFDLKNSPTKRLLSQSEHLVVKSCFWLLVLSLGYMFGNMILEFYQR